MNLKRGLMLAAVFFGICLLFFSVKLIGFASNTPSMVSVEQRISVNSSSFDGATTNFSNMNNNQLRNINEMTLERTSYGKIIFQESVDLTLDKVNWTVDLDSNVNISRNYIEIDTDKLTSLEKQAVIYLYNLTFSNPRIMRNGAVCPGSICQEIDYSSGTLIFTVTSFTNYSAEETPVTPVPQVPSAGGGGGGVGLQNFSLDKDLIKVSIKQGENAKEYLAINNTGNTEINILLEVSKLERFVILSDEKFILKAGESKIIGVDFAAKEDEAADLYLGKIIVSGAGIKKAVSIILEVKERNPLFDIKTEILNKIVRPGEKVRTLIKITNMGDLKNIDAVLYTAIINLDGETIDYKDESIAIEKELNLTRSMNVPNLPDGKYLFYSRVSYGNISASSSEVFEVMNLRQPISRNILIAFLVILFLTTAIMMIRLYLSRKREREMRKVKK